MGGMKIRKGIWHLEVVTFPPQKIQHTFLMNFQKDEFIKKIYGNQKIKKINKKKHTNMPTKLLLNAACMDTFHKQSFVNKPQSIISLI